MMLHTVSFEFLFAKRRILQENTIICVLEKNTLKWYSYLMTDVLKNDLQCRSETYVSGGWYMDNFILIICKILDAILNPSIVLLAIVELILTVIVVYNLSGLRRELERISGDKAIRKARKVIERGKKHEISTESHFERSWEDYDALCAKYQKQSQWYSAFSLIIQLFTLLGILGTVAGLFIAMHDNPDWTNAGGMFEGVKFALSSTVLGIIFAIIFKTIDIIISSVYVNYIDDGIERFKGNYSEDKECIDT